MGNLLDQIIESAVINVHVFSKTKFDNARDTTEMLTAATMSNELLIQAITEKMALRREELVIEHLENALRDNKDVVVRIGAKWYRIEEAKAQIEKLLQSEALEELKGVQRVETVEVNYQYEDGSVVSLNQRIKQLETHLNMLTESTYPDNVLKNEGNVNISSKEKV